MADRQQRGAVLEVDEYVLEDDGAIMTLPRNVGRNGVILQNGTDGVVYIRYGGVASPDAYTYAIVSRAIYEMAEPTFLGTVSILLDGSTEGSVQVTEL